VFTVVPTYWQDVVEHTVSSLVVGVVTINTHCIYSSIAIEAANWPYSKPPPTKEAQTHSL